MAAEVATNLSDKAASYLRQPYARIVIPETDGTYRGEILEFPGCFATGDTPTETLDALEDVAAAWLEAALDHGQPIPPPVENAEFSGRLVLRMPKNLHKKAARLAEREGVSLNQFIVTSLAEHIGQHAHPIQGQITLNTANSNVMNLGTFFVHGQNPNLGIGHTIPIVASTGVHLVQSGTIGGSLTTSAVELARVRITHARS